jgi:hypothetical protein
MIDPEQEREDFISIRDLVGIIASSTGKPEQRAAAMLAASLAKDPAWSRLAFHEWSQSYGCVALEENGRRENAARQRLNRWAEYGNDKPGFEDFDDDIPF